MGQKRPLNIPVPVPEVAPTVVHGQTDTASAPAIETSTIKVREGFDFVRFS